jgi:SOS-response transcriptional repressor LexA
MKKQLTDKQKAILDYIKEYILVRKCSPTVIELAEAFNISEPTMFYHVLALQKKGAITRTGKARSITPTLEDNAIIEDYMLIRAYKPSAKLERVYLSKQRFPDYYPEDFFFVRMPDDGLKSLGIQMDDIVIALYYTESFELYPGGLVVAAIGEDITVRSYFPYGDDNIILRSVNSNFPEIRGTKKEIKILGVVAALERNYL